MKYVVLIFLSILSAFATDYTNTTGTFVDVNALLNASTNGDRIFIKGPVTNTWTTFATIPAGVQLIGTNKVEISLLASGKILTGSTHNMVRISGIKFYHGGTSSSDSCIYLKGQGFYVDNCSFISLNNTKKLGVFSDGANTLLSPNGCVSHCYFYKTRYLAHVGGICVSPPGCTSASLEWTNVTRLGTTNQAVFEDCHFEQVQATLYNSTDDEYAGCYSVRFSSFTNTTAEAHSNGSGQMPQERAGRCVEIYGNTFQSVAPISLGSLPIFVRGGTGGAWSNTINGTWPSTTKVIKFDAERGWSKAGKGQSPVDGNFAIDQHGSGTHTGINLSGDLVITSANYWTPNILVTGTGVSAFWLYNITDGSKGVISANTTNKVTAVLSGGTRNLWNTGDAYVITGGYPLRDQIGTIQDVFQWKLTNNPPDQIQFPFYYHANIINGNPAGIFIDPTSTFWIVDGRDITNALPTWSLLTYPHPLVSYYGGFTNPPPVASQLAFIQQPSDTVVGSSITPAITVQVQDNTGTIVTNSTASVTLAIGTNPSGGTLSGTLTHAAVNGLATFSGLSINNSGNGYTLTAASGTLTGTNSTSFNVAALPPPAAAKVVFIQQPSDTIAGASITPAITVEIQDSSNVIVTNGSASVTLSISANPGAGTLSGTKTVASTNGIATFSGLSIDKIGTGYTLLASSGALTTDTSSTFNIIPGADTKLAFSQQPTITVVNATITPAVTVQVQDAFGNLTTSSASVDIAIGTNPGGGTLSGTTTQTAVSGLATFGDLAIDQTGTNYTLSVSSGILTGTNSVNFNIIAGLPPSPPHTPIVVNGSVTATGQVILNTQP